MKNNYLDMDALINNDKPYHRSAKLAQQEKLSYQQTISYVLDHGEQQIGPIYAQLPEEYAIFSEIDDTFFSLNDTEQHRLLSRCLQHLKVQLVNLYIKSDIVRILPKLKVTSDEDGAIVLNWAYTSFRVYFNFEADADNSYYGIVAQTNEDSIFTNSGKLNFKNYISVINNILLYVVENS